MRKGFLLPATVILTAIAMLAIILSAPTERTMGDSQRIVYIHVAVAWCGLANFLVMAGAGLMYLRRRNLAWDHWAQAAAELGWLGATLTLITGSIWAHAAWNTWWSWDPRLATTLRPLGNQLRLPRRSQRVGGSSPPCPDRSGAGHPRRRRSSLGGHGHPLVSRRPPRLAANGAFHAGRVAGQRGGLTALFTVLLMRRGHNFHLERLVATLESEVDR